MQIQFLKNSLSQLADDLIGIDESNFSYKTFTIMCNELPVPKEEGNIYYYHLYKTLFDELDINKEYPYIYWFEIKSGFECKKIRSHVSIYDQEVKNELSRKLIHAERNFYGVPAMTSSIKDINSKVLYVGKVKRDLKGRLVPHLGYYHRSPNTQGLQLARWSKDIDLHLEFHYIRLPKELKEIASYLEFKLAKELKPILGRHRG